MLKNMKIMTKENNYKRNSSEYINDQQQIKYNSDLNLETLQKERNDNLISLFLSQSKTLDVLKGDKIGINFEDIENELHHYIIKQAKSVLDPSKINDNSNSKKSDLKSTKTFCHRENRITNNNLFSNTKFEKKNTSTSGIICKIFPSREIFMEKAYRKGLIAKKGTEIQRKKDLNNPYIYSYDEWNPFSFCTGHRKYGYENGQLKSPSPIFLDNEEWCRKQDMTLNGILSGIKITEEEGLLLIDPSVCEKFSGMLGDLLKQLLQAIFGHKISLNVKLFEPKSLTQTLTNYFCNAPKFCFKGANPKITALERMKNVVSLGISGLYLNAKQLKPFNPLISETFQGYFDLDNLEDDKNKIEVFTEQISNYPTATRFYILNKSFKMYGYWDLSLEMKNCGNKIVCITKGTSTVDFFNLNEKISFCFPDTKILNAISQENRSAHYTGVMIFFDIKNKLRCIIQFAKDKKHISNFIGYIFKYNFPKDYVFDFDKECKELREINFEDPDKITIFEPESILSTITGSWLSEICFDGVKYWDINKDLPVFIKPCINCLPSDCRFREDLIWLYRSFYKSKNEEERVYYEKLAQSWKLMIEKVQREERTAKAKLNEELNKRSKTK